MPLSVLEFGPRIPLAEAWALTPAWPQPPMCQLFRGRNSGLCRWTRGSHRHLRPPSPPSFPPRRPRRDFLTLVANHKARKKKPRKAGLRVSLTTRASTKAAERRRRGGDLLFPPIRGLYSVRRSSGISTNLRVSKIENFNLP